MFALDSSYVYESCTDIAYETSVQYSILYSSSLPIIIIHQLLYAGSARESKRASTSAPPATTLPESPLPKRVLNDGELEVLQKAFKSNNEVRAC